MRRASRRLRGARSTCPSGEPRHATPALVIDARCAGAREGLADYPMAADNVSSPPAALGRIPAHPAPRARTAAFAAYNRAP
jgi:hypothetical protein